MDLVSVQYIIFIMRGFTKNEVFGVAAIFAVLIAVTLYNLQIAVRRSRDVQRRNDLGAVSDALNKFQAEFGYFPPSENGKIKMCKGDNFDEVVAQINTQNEFDRNLFFEGLRACEWGQDSLTDVTDSSYEPYLKNIPQDPKTTLGVSYLYLANVNRYQLYSSLEGGTSETGYDQNIVKRNLNCGNQICSYGKTHSAPLDKSIEEYEAELFDRSRRSN